MARERYQIEREKKALEQRSANERALENGEPLPYPNIWDELDPTKLERGASDEEIHERVAKFLTICRRPPCRKHTL